MSDIIFSIFPNENFVDLSLYQFGWERCEPSHIFGPAARNHYLFHYVISGTGKLYADDASGHTRINQIKSGQGFMIFPNQVNTYIADKDLGGVRRAAGTGGPVHHRAFPRCPCLPRPFP